MSERPSMWTRVIADPVFRDALVADPLRALAEAPGLETRAEHVRMLEAMDRPEREAFVRELLREAMARRARQEWGDRVWSPDMGAEPPG